MSFIDSQHAVAVNMLPSQSLQEREGPATVHNFLTPNSISLVQTSRRFYVKFVRNSGLPLFLQMSVATLCTSV